MWSTLPNTDEITRGAIDVPFFAAKALVDDHIRAIGLPATFVLPGSFFTNLVTFYAPTKAADGVFEWSTAADPGVRYPWTNPRADTGPVVLRVLERGQPTYERVPITSTQRTFPELVAEYAQLTGTPARYVQRTPTAEERSAAPVFQQLQLNLFEYYSKHGYYGGLEFQEGWSPVDVLLPTFADFVLTVKPIA